MEKENVEIEFETVPVRIPKAVMDLLRAFRNDGEDYLTTLIVHSVASTLDADFSIGNGEIVSYWNIVERFRLKRVFEVFDCKMPVHKDC